MKHVILGRLAAFALLLVISAFSSMGTAQAQGSDEGLIPVCVQGFESTPGCKYLTQAQIDEIEATWAAYDQSDIPPPQITGYPDPATGSCATESGVPVDYDPEFYTLVCVGSGPEGDGPLVPQLAINHYLGGADDIILADPETGACPQEEVAEDHTHPLLIMVRNCDSELIVFFTKPQEGCVPGDGAFFNVISDSGEFLGNCEASINASNPAPSMPVVSFRFPTAARVLSQRTWLRFPAMLRTVGPPGLSMPHPAPNRSMGKITARSSSTCCRPARAMAASLPSSRTRGVVQHQMAPTACC